MSDTCRPGSQYPSDGGVNDPDTGILRKRSNVFLLKKQRVPAKKLMLSGKQSVFNTFDVFLFRVKQQK